MFLKRKVIYILALAACLTAIIKYWHITTGGFRTDKIQPPIDTKDELCELPSLSKEELSKIFDQEYRYLDKGCQVFVFESMDGNYVLKFIRHHRYKPYFWMNIGSFIPSINKHREAYAKAKKIRIKNNIQSYMMSFNELQDLTEVIYVHLGTTHHINRLLTVKSKFGTKSYLDLDRLHYVVQKKSQKLSSELLTSYRNKDYENVQNLIDQYLLLLQKRCFRKIRNCDASGFIRNMAVYKGKVIEIDAGGYRRFTSQDDINYEFSRFEKRFNRWIAKNMPSFEEYFVKKSDEVKKQAFLQTF